MQDADIEILRLRDVGADTGPTDVWQKVRIPTELRTLRASVPALASDAAFAPMIQRRCVEEASSLRRLDAQTFEAYPYPRL